MRLPSRSQAIDVLIPLSRHEQVALVGGSLPCYQAPSIRPLVEPAPHTLAAMLLASAGTLH